MRRAIAGGALRHLGGWRRAPARPAAAREPHPAFEAALLPSHAYLQLYGVIPVFDQGGVGDCTAQMGRGQMAFLEVHAGRPFVEFSAFNLYAATRHGIEGVPLNEDSGAQIRDVMLALKQFGVCTERTWPSPDDGHSFAKAPSVEATSEALSHQALYFYHCPTLRSIKASLGVHGFPVGFGFSVPENLMSDHAAATGEVLYPAPGEDIVGGHAVVAIGYDDHRVIGKETGAVRCRNSWSADWGQGGDFWLPYRMFNEQIADDAWTLRSAEL